MDFKMEVTAIFNLILILLIPIITAVALSVLMICLLWPLLYLPLSSKDSQLLVGGSASNTMLFLQNQIFDFMTRSTRLISPSKMTSA